MSSRSVAVRHSVTAVLLAFVGLFVGLGARPAAGEDKPPLLHLQLLIVGPQLTVKQQTLAVPRNIPTVLNTEITLQTEQIDRVAFTAQYLGGALVEAELRGPAPPNGDLPIPAIPVAGKYLLENLRLTRGGETLFLAQPRVVPIEGRWGQGSQLRYQRPHRGFRPGLLAWHHGAEGTSLLYCLSCEAGQSVIRLGDLWGMNPASVSSAVEVARAEAHEPEGREVLVDRPMPEARGGEASGG